MQIMWTKGHRLIQRISLSSKLLPTTRRYPQHHYHLYIAKYDISKSSRSSGSSGGSISSISKLSGSAGGGRAYDPDLRTYLEQVSEFGAEACGIQLWSANLHPSTGMNVHS